MPLQLDFLPQQRQGEQGRDQNQQRPLSFLPEMKQDRYRHSALPGMTNQNWMHYASEAIQKKQEELDRLGRPRLRPSEQLAIQDSYRQMVGKQPVSAGRDFFREAQLASAQESPWLNLSNVALSRMAGTGTGLVGLVSPAAGRSLQETAQAEYGPEAEGFSKTLGETIGGAWSSAPAIINPVLGAAALGASAAGQTRMDIAARREQGEDISGWREALGAAGSGAIEMGTEYIGAKIGQALGKVLRQAGPGLRQAYAQGGFRQAIKRLLPTALQFELGAAGEGLEEVAAALGENAWSRMIHDPSVTLEQAIGESVEGFKQGWRVMHLLGPLAAGVQASGGGGGAMQRQAAQQPAAAQRQGVAPVDQAAILESFARDESVPEAAKQQVAERLGEIRDAGTPATEMNISQVIQEVMAAQGQQAWTETPLGQVETAQRQWRGESPLFGEQQAATTARAVAEQPAAPEAVIPGQAERMAASRSQAAEAIQQRSGTETETAVSPVEQPSPLRSKGEGDLGADATPGVQESKLSRQRLRELVERARTAEREAGTDALTGLATRRAFDRAAAKLREQAESRGKPVSVLSIDLTNFKALNDTLGHDAGDRALQIVAESMAPNIRAKRRPGQPPRPADAPGIVGRTGGDEFTIAIEGDPAAAEVVAGRIKQAVENRLAEEGFAEAGGKRVGLDVGVAEWASGEPVQSALREADEGMFEAKRAEKTKRGEALEREPAAKPAPVAEVAQSRQQLAEQQAAEVEAKPAEPIRQERQPVRPQPAEEPTGGVRVTQQAREQALIRGRQEAEESRRRTERREVTKEATPETERVFNLTLKDNLTAELKKQIGGEKDLLSQIAKDPGNNDAVLKYTSRHMGLLKRIARRFAGQGADASFDDILQAGVAELQRAMTTPVARGKHKGKLRAEVMLETDAKASSFLFGRNGLVHTAMRRTAFPMRGRRGEISERGQPETSLEAAVERMSADAGREAALPGESQAQRRALREAEGEGPDLSPETLEIAEQAKQMLADGASEQEVRAFIEEAQDRGEIHFLPDAAKAVAQGRAPSVEMVSSTLQVREALNAMKRGRGVELHEVKPVSYEEQIAQQWAESRGLATAFVVGKQGSRAPMRGSLVRPATGPSTVLVRSGQGINAMWETITHEVAHGLDLDQLPLSDKRALAAAEQEYLDKSPQWKADQLKRHPFDLRREATALIIGEVMADPKARAALQQQAPTLFEKVWQRVKDAVADLVDWVRVGERPKHSRRLVRDVVTALRKSDGAANTAVLRGIDLLPESNLNRQIETDADKFFKDLQDVLKEKPKISGRPELANPMNSEVNRRLMDHIDEIRKQTGQPERQTEAKWVAEGKKLLRNQSRRGELVKAVKQGAQLDPVQTVAAKELMRDQADKAMKDPSLTNILAVQEMGMGWREGGTEQARAMRARQDNIKRPAERMKEFIAGSLGEVPEKTAKRIRRLKESGRTSEADKLIREHGEKAARLIRKWKEDGIDPAALDDMQSQDPRVMARVIKDLRNLSFGTGTWDVIHEIRRNHLMYAPLTWIRNTLGGFYAVADVFVTKPVARSIRSLVTGKAATGETAAAWHAWGSQNVIAKALQNAALSIMYEVPMLETQIRVTGQKLRGASEVEIHSPPAITGEGVKRAVELAGKTLRSDGPLTQKAAAASKQLVAALGHIERIPQRVNTAVDEIFKTMHLYSEVAAWAVRVGQAKGLEIGTPEMQRFVDGQMADMTSEAFQAAVESKESWRVAYQGDAGAFERAILRATSKEFGPLGNVLRLLVPFRKTPMQLAGQALMHTPGVGGVRMLQRALESRAGGKKYTADEFSRHAAQQIIGMIGTAMIWNLAGDSDDDEGWIRITGPAAYARQFRRERVTQQQRRPFMGVRLGGKWYNYNYVEPFSQWLGTVAAFAEEMKRASDGEHTAEPSKVAMRLWHRMSGMYSDQTYLRTVGDLVKAWNDPEYYGERLTVNFAGSWLPNIVDTSLRSADPKLRESRVRGTADERADWWAQVRREMLPTGNILPPPKVDFFGNDVTVPHQTKNPTSVFMIRLLSPVSERTTVEGKQADVLDMVVKYNEGRIVGGDEPGNKAVWFQEPSDKVTVRYPNVVKPVLEQMNEEEYYWYAKLGGMLAAREIEKRDWPVQSPTDRDIARLEEIFSVTRSAAREYVTAARQAKALGQMDRYGMLMGRLRQAVRDLETGASK